MQRKSQSFQPLALVMTILAALLRLAPHPPNFSPIGGVALFGGARLRGWLAYLVPLLALAITDPIRSKMEGGYPAYSSGTIIVYASFMISVFLGRTFLRNSAGPLRIATVAFAGSLQFYLITNFFTWFGARDMYPHTLAGLTACYVAGLPFYARTLLGDLFFSGALFGVYALLSRRMENERSVAAA
jgi:hypothetical protein